jgi:Tol biopolymer transport system component
VVASPITATPDTRLPPEDWQAWPVVPQATGRARQIYQQGLAQGVDAHAFSKIGDCQSIKEALMGMFDKPGRYQLPSEQMAALQETIDQFSGSFNRDGMAVKGGFNAASVLSPMWADPSCQAGETPLECEVRVHRPSFVIISLEVWWQGRTTQRYVDYMRKIIDYAIAHGAVPILSTKADNVEGDNSLNLATAQLAYEYDLPLWNFWRAVQPLPHHGMDPLRNDGFHISEDYAWPVRSLTALQALDAVWRGVSGVPAVTSTAPALTQTPEIPQASPTAEPGAALPVVLTPGSLSGKLVFTVQRRSGSLVSYQGIYAFDPQTLQRIQVIGNGFKLQAAAADGLALLVNQATDLYLVTLDGAPPLLLTHTFYPVGQQGAAWLADGKRLAVIDSHDGSPALWLVDPPHSMGVDAVNVETWTRLTLAESSPVELYVSPDATQLYWGQGPCSLQGCTTPPPVWVSTLDAPTERGLSSAAPAAAQRELTGVRSPAFPQGQNPAGAYFAYTRSDAKSTSSLFVSKLGSQTERKVDLGGTAADYRLLNYVWSPDGKQLALQILQRDSYTGAWEKIRNVLLGLPSYGTKELVVTNGLEPHVTWSPNGQRLLLTSTLQTNNQYSLSFRLLDLTTNKVTQLDDKIGLSNNDFTSLTNIFWVK